MSCFFDKSAVKPNESPTRAGNSVNEVKTDSLQEKPDAEFIDELKSLLTADNVLGLFK